MPSDRELRCTSFFHVVAWSARDGDTGFARAARSVRVRLGLAWDSFTWSKSARLRAPRGCGELVSPSRCASWRGRNRSMSSAGVNPGRTLRSLRTLCQHDTYDPSARTLAGITRPSSVPPTIPDGADLGVAGVVGGDGMIHRIYSASTQGSSTALRTTTLAILYVPRYIYFLMAATARRPRGRRSRGTR